MLSDCALILYDAIVYLKTVTAAYLNHDALEVLAHCDAAEFDDEIAQLEARSLGLDLMRWKYITQRVSICFHCS